MGDLNKLLSRLPIVFFAVLYAGWMGYDYYEWLHSPESELGKRKAAVVSAKKDLDGDKAKLKTGEEFFRNLDSIRQRIRQMTAQLDSTKAVLSADIDIANFVRMITLEANKLGIVVKGIKPELDSRKEYYLEVPFKVLVKGAYVQLLVFFDRVAKFSQVIRVSGFEMKPSGNQLTKYVELDSSVTLVAYKYLGTHADEILNKDEMKDTESAPVDKAPRPDTPGEAGKHE